MKPLLIRTIPVFLILLFTGTGIHAQLESVKIGGQVWMKKNLNVSKFRNGISIPEVRDAMAWEAAGKAKQPAWCYYGNDPDNGAKYGKLYNWYAMADSRGLCPSGWHVPSDAEWKELTDSLGKEIEPGTKMKATVGWENYKGSSGNGSNESGFSGLPGGSRYTNGFFLYLGEIGYWWSSNELDSYSGWSWSLNHVSGYVSRSYDGKVFGLSVRCIKD